MAVASVSSRHADATSLGLLDRMPFDFLCYLREQKADLSMYEKPAAGEVPRYFALVYPPPPLTRAAAAAATAAVSSFREESSLSPAAALLQLLFFPAITFSSCTGGGAAPLCPSFSPAACPLRRCMHDCMDSSSSRSRRDSACGRQQSKSPQTQDAPDCMQKTHCLPSKRDSLQGCRKLRYTAASRKSLQETPLSTLSHASNPPLASTCMHPATAGDGVLGTQQWGSLGKEESLLLQQPFLSLFHEIPCLLHWRSCASPTPHKQHSPALLSSSSRGDENRPLLHPQHPQLTFQQEPLQTSKLHNTCCCYACFAAAVLRCMQHDLRLSAPPASVSWLSPCPAYCITSCLQSTAAAAATATSSSFHSGSNSSLLPSPMSSSLCCCCCCSPSDAPSAAAAVALPAVHSTPPQRRRNGAAVEAPGHIYAAGSASAEVAPSPSGTEAAAEATSFFVRTIAGPAAKSAFKTRAASEGGRSAVKEAEVLTAEEEAGDTAAEQAAAVTAAREALGCRNTSAVTRYSSFRAIFALPAGVSPRDCLPYKLNLIHPLDAASAACVAALRPRQGDSVCDLCCAPGNKLLLLARAVQTPQQQDMCLPLLQTACSAGSICCSNSDSAAKRCLRHPFAGAVAILREDQGDTGTTERVEPAAAAGTEYDVAAAESKEARGGGREAAAVETAARQETIEAKTERATSGEDAEAAADLADPSKETAAAETPGRAAGEAANDLRLRAAAEARRRTKGVVVGVDGRRERAHICRRMVRRYGAANVLLVLQDGRLFDGSCTCSGVYALRGKQTRQKQQKGRRQQQQVGLLQQQQQKALPQQQPLHVALQQRQNVEKERQEEGKGKQQGDNLVDWQRQLKQEKNQTQLQEQARNIQQQEAMQTSDSVPQQQVGHTQQALTLQLHQQQENSEKRTETPQRQQTKRRDKEMLLLPQPGGRKGMRKGRLARRKAQQREEDEEVILLDMLAETAAAATAAKEHPTAATRVSATGRPADGEMNRLSSAAEDEAAATAGGTVDRSTRLGVSRRGLGAATAAGGEQKPTFASAARATANMLERFDRVLVDAECTHDASLRHMQKFGSQWKWEDFEKKMQMGNTQQQQQGMQQQQVERTQQQQAETQQQMRQQQQEGTQQQEGRQQQQGTQQHQQEGMQQQQQQECMHQQEEWKQQVEEQVRQQQESGESDGVEKGEWEGQLREEGREEDVEKQQQFTQAEHGQLPLFNQDGTEHAAVSFVAAAAAAATAKASQQMCVVAGGSGGLPCKGRREEAIAGVLRVAGERAVGNQAAAGCAAATAQVGRELDAACEAAGANVAQRDGAAPERRRRRKRRSEAAGSSEDTATGRETAVRGGRDDAHDMATEEESGAAEADAAAAATANEKSLEREREVDQEDTQLFKAIRKRQAGLLQRGFDLLKPGGLLVYSTCSGCTDQNEGIVRRLLQENSTAALYPLPCGGLKEFDQLCCYSSTSSCSCCTTPPLSSPCCCCCFIASSSTCLRRGSCVSSGCCCGFEYASRYCCCCSIQKGRRECSRYSSARSPTVSRSESVCLNSSSRKGVRLCRSSRKDRFCSRTSSSNSTRYEVPRLGSSSFNSCVSESSCSSCVNHLASNTGSNIVHSSSSISCNSSNSSSSTISTSSSFSISSTSSSNSSNRSSSPSSSSSSVSNSSCYCLSCVKPNGVAVAGGSCYRECSRGLRRSSSSSSRAVGGSACESWTVRSTWDSAVTIGAAATGAEEMREEETAETSLLPTPAKKDAAGLCRASPGQPSPPWKENAVGAEGTAAEIPAVSAGAAVSDEGKKELAREAAARDSFHVSAATAAAETDTSQVKAHIAVAAGVEPAAAAAEAKEKILWRKPNPAATAGGTGNSKQTAETPTGEEHTAAHVTHTCDSLQQQRYSACSQQQDEDICCWWPARPSALEFDFTLRRHPAALRTSAEPEGRAVVEEAGRIAAAVRRAVPAATAGRAATGSNELRPTTLEAPDIDAEEGNVSASAAGKNSKDKGNSKGSAAVPDTLATSTSAEGNHLKGDIGAVEEVKSVSLLKEQEDRMKVQQHFFRPCSCYFGPRQSHTSGLFLACVTKVKAEPH